MKQLVVCGPTASGKSELSDAISEISGGSSGVVPRTVLFDSMQVYRELPVISNQHRRLPAELAGIVSVTNEWSAAHHREAAGRATEVAPDDPHARFILEAGTGMYLNAFLLNIDMAPRVPDEIRLEAERRVEDGSHRASDSGERETNPRRAVRAEELRLAGFSGSYRGSIWDGSLSADTAFVYLRPERNILDSRIKVRSSRIASEGLEEAAHVLSLSRSEPEYPTRFVSRTVLDSIGVRELIEVTQGARTIEEAEERISTRTRQLARRQMRWFDKLLSTLKTDPKLHRVRILTGNPADEMNTMPVLDDIIGWWMD